MANLGIKRKKLWMFLGLGHHHYYYWAIFTGPNFNICDCDSQNSIITLSAFFGLKIKYLIPFDKYRLFTEAMPLTVAFKLNWILLAELGWKLSSKLSLNILKLRYELLYNVSCPLETFINIQWWVASKIPSGLRL